MQVNAFLYKNLCQYPSGVKCNCYKSIVRRIVEYVSSVWDPHTTTTIVQIEVVQRRAAWFCLNNFSRHSSVSNMLATLNLPYFNYKEQKLE